MTTRRGIPTATPAQTYTINTRKIRPGSQVLTLDNAFPGEGTPAARTNVALFPPDNKYSSVVQWSFDIQRELPAKVFLTVGYVGSKTSHLDASVYNFNSPDPSTNTDINSQRPYQAYVSQGEGNQPHLLNNIRYLDSYANGNYNGLQVSAEKRYSAGLTVGLAYVYSKALGEGPGRNDPSGDLTQGYQNPRNRRADRGRYGFDVTHNAVANYVYDLPVFRHAKGINYVILGGWQTSGVITMRTGFPFSVYGGNLNTGGEHAVRVPPAAALVPGSSAVRAHPWSRRRSAQIRCPARGQESAPAWSCPSPARPRKSGRAGCRSR